MLHIGGKSSPQSSPRAAAQNDASNILHQVLTRLSDLVNLQTSMSEQMSQGNSRMDKQFTDLKAELHGHLGRVSEGLRSLEQHIDRVAGQYRSLATSLTQGGLSHNNSLATNRDSQNSLQAVRSLQPTQSRQFNDFKKYQRQNTQMPLPDPQDAARRGPPVKHVMSSSQDDDDDGIGSQPLIRAIDSEQPDHLDRPTHSPSEEGSGRKNSRNISDSDGEDLDADPVTRTRRSLRRSGGQVHQIHPPQPDLVAIHDSVNHTADTQKAWPGYIQARPEFTSRIKNEPTTRDELLALIFRNKVKQSRESMSPSAMRDNNAADNRPRCHPIHPDSAVRILWDVLSFFVLVLDITVVPFVLSWQIELGGIWLAFSLATFLFWCLDMMMSFITGFYLKGTLFMTFTEIANQYVKGWFMLDSAILLVDLVSIITWALQGRRTRAGQLLRAGKLFRLVRVTRLFKLFESVLQRNVSDNVRIFLQIAQQVVWILWATHMLCCAWYAIGKFAPSDTGLSWLDMQYDGVEYQDASVAYQYFTSLHWGASQIAAGNMDLQPLSTAERAFNTLCLVFGLIFGSALVSALSATMMDLRDAKQEQTKELRLLRQYMIQNNIEPETMVRMQKHAMDRMAHQRLKDDDVPALKLLSSTLQAELRWSAFRPTLITHAVFRLIEMLDSETLHKLCNSAVEFVYPAHGDEVFTTGEKAMGPVVMVWGRMQYVQHPSSGIVDEEIVTEIDEGMWCAEASLWSMWVHVGTAVTSFSCQLLRIRARNFARTVNRNPLTREVAEEYAKRFHTSLVKVAPHSALPTDLHVPYTGFSEVVLSMSQPYQEAISRITFEHLQKEHRRLVSGFLGGSGKGLQELEEEVRSGSCTLLENGKGETERVVALSVLRITDESGSIFAHIGSWEGDGGLPKAKLPGAKQKAGEMASDTIRRLLKGDLKVLASKVELQHTEQVTEMKESASFHINTIYLKTVQLATITGPFECTKFVCSFSLVGGGDMEMHSSYQPLVPSRDIYVIPDARKNAMYTWLKPEEFDYLNTPAGQKALAAVLEKTRAEPNISELVENSRPRRSVHIAA